MKEIVTLSRFRQVFKNVRPGSFSYNGLEALFDYLEEIDTELEFDVIAIDSDFAEHETIEDASSDTGYSKDEIEEMIAVHFEKGIIIHNR